jgi:hypothetical protein
MIYPHLGGKLPSVLRPGTSAQKLVEAELNIRAKFGLHEDVRRYDSTRRGSPLL